MKKFISILLVICIFLLTAGCFNNTSNPITTAESTGSSVTGDKPIKWPTESWSTSTPEEQGMDSAVLSNMDERIHENYPNIYSVLVVRHGYLVYEKYYQGMSKDSYNPVYSVTKSVMSALTGIALRDKLITSIDQKISDYLPDYFANIDDTRKNDITIWNTLTMSAGLESIDSDYYSYFSSDNWFEYTLGKPLTDDPGAKFVYNTGLTHFLSALITETSGMSTLDFANQYLFSKIGVSVKRWDTDPQGYYCGGSELYLTPVDMAKFGFLYLQNGVWDGNQIIPKEWIEESTKEQIAISAEEDYGYLFWLKTMTDKEHNKDYFTYRASGAGGQNIVIIPELDMVIVITANIQVDSKDKSVTLDIIPNYILPAVKYS